ncbi:MAG TPA: MFS transporter [Stellaceae bacterium]|nr:MFS transporter [Stellaceae bacterium]
MIGARARTRRMAAGRNPGQAGLGKAVAESPFKIDIAAILAGRRVGRLQFEIVGLCALVMFVDGLNSQTLIHAAPTIARSMLLNPGALGPAFTYGGFGSLIGILAAAPLADLIGRRPVILGGMVAAALFTLITAWAGTVTQFAVIRFLAGLGLGAVMPAALALAAEFMPRRHRITLTLLVWLGFSIGSGLAGPFTSYVVPIYGWPVVFITGAAMPVIALPVLWTALPESPLFLVRMGESANLRIRATLIRISRRYDRLRTNEFFSSERSERGFPLVLLLRGGRALITALLWVMFFSSLVTIFFVNNLLPSVLNNAQLSENAASTIAAIAQFGGLAGGVAIAWAADRFDRYLVLAGAFLLGAISIVALGTAGRAGLGVGLALICAGFFALGVQYAANAVAAASYPTAMRASGVGWAIGLGRNGQIVAPTIAAMLVSLKLATSHTIYLLAFPGLIAAAAALVIAFSGRRFGDERGKEQT